ncbi:hypothetical protein Glove_196g32 [Diversispora epigaea]|uniref:BTB domain-containing protein n=1 Tax=Diversispora epigaea TaxID=1348612 RepID=A0A397INF6_9GLOM|nr:hypothetical protein Glove_196g32 [Diversispora epigaea]
MSFKLFEKLSQNFIELLNDKNDYNVIVEVENKKSFTAHSNILKCRSTYFLRELENMIPNENNIKTITKPNISNQIFNIILKIIFDLMKAANEFEIEELTKKLENHLIETKSSWLKSHFSLVYRSIFSGNNFKDLEKFCNDIVVKYPNLIFEAEDFASIQESALISLLKRDDLQLEEIKVWEYIIKWGIAQNSTLPAELEEWTKENFTSLKTTLQQCLPLIRYFYIPDLNQRFMTPDQPVKSIILPSRTILVQKLPTRTTEQTKPLSTIITYEHVTEISSWLDRKSSTYSLTNIPYEFQLILRGSINGFAPQTFWDTCHGHASTVVIMKVKGTEEILGGYNPLILDSNNADYNHRWDNTNDSFIFSLKNGNIQNSILSRVKIPTNAILNVGESSQRINGNDLYMYSHNCARNNNSVHYEKPIRKKTDYFSIVDYEVFKVIKKTCNYKIPWDNTNDSFIFSLKNGNIQNSILSRVKIPTNAILNVGESSQRINGNDLYMYSHNCARNNNSVHYEKPIRKKTDYFSIVDYEVFKKRKIFGKSEGQHQNLCTFKYICGLSIPTGQRDSNGEYCQFKKCKHNTENILYLIV